MKYYVYLVECTDKSLYCGYTTDISRRITEHNDSKKGAKYTKSKRPIILKYYEEFNDLSSALKREHEIKSFSKAEKLKLCETRAV